MILRDIAKINPETKNHFDDQENISYLDTSNITKNFIGDFQTLVVGVDKIPSRAKRKVKDNDIVYSTIRPINMHFGFLRNPPKDLVVSTGFVVVRVDPTKANPRFIYEYLTQGKFTAHMQNIGEDSTSTYPGIRPDDLLSIEIDLPSKKTQDFISAFATKIDNKIKLNQKMNKTLEEIAKTLFKSWFIDFDPVRAKVKGRPTGLPKEISDLFPDSFEKSEFGEIPMGWSKNVITDIANKISDKYKKNEDWSNEKLIDLSRMPLNSVSLNSYGRGDELSTSVCKFKKYDFLFGSIRPYFFKAGICPYDGVSNTSVFILRAKKTYDREFMYFYSSSETTFEKSVQFSDGTKMPIIKWKDFKEFPFTMPNEDLRKHFSSIINPIVKKIICNINEQEVLFKLKDTLLPKLISGVLKIPDAEKLVEEVCI